MANILKTEKKVAVISMLCEGASIRSIERITGVHGGTIGRLALCVGQACKAIMDEKMKGLTCLQIEVDEIWGFIGAKQKNAARAGAFGDVWTFIALDSDSKLIPSFVVGKRDAYHAKMFVDDLASRLSMRVQISSDALAAYPDAFERSFGADADYGQIVKTFSVTPLGNAAAPAAVRYSPADVVKVERSVISGMPDVARITTSHVEKQNHTLRMHCRRLTRLTNAFSKKLENFEAAVALNFAYYNFAKNHKAIRMTSAMAAGVENSHWTVAELVERCGDKSDFLARLQAAVSQLHNCGAVWRESVPVTEIFRGKTLWRGEVEVFDLAGHPKARRAYGWSHPEGQDSKGERFVAVLELPPVDSPQTAVKMAIYSDIKQEKTMAKKPIPRT